MELFNRNGKDVYFNNEDNALNILNSIIKDGVKRNGELYISSLNLTVSVKILQVTNQYANGVFKIMHESFNETLTDSVAAIGDSMQDSIKNVVWIFAMGTLTGIIDALKEEDGKRLTVKYYDGAKHYKMYRSQQVSIGKKDRVETVDFWNLIGNDVTKRLGNNKVQWVKVYAAKTKSGVNCECKINGIINNELTDILKPIANKWTLKDFIYSEKQYFYFVQDETTFNLGRTTASDIIDYTQQAFKMYALVEDEDEYKELQDKFYNITDDENLATELFCFIPEIVCEEVCNEVTYLDEMVIQTPSKAITMYKNQLSNFNIIREAIVNIIKKKEPSRDEIKNILRFSASMKSINEVLDEGYKINELMVTRITYNVGEAYTPS